MKDLLKFSLKVVFSIILFFCLLEGVLQLLAIFNPFKAAQCSDALERGGPGQLRILCVGDSFTFGVGAGFQNSYPAQLQRSIREKYPALKVEIVNKGEPGANSSEVAAQLSGYLKQFRPQIVLCCIGRNDNWNFEKVDFEALKDSLGHRPIKYQREGAWIKFRTYKLFRYLFESVALQKRGREQVLSRTGSHDAREEARIEKSKVELAIGRAQDCVRNKDPLGAMEHLNSVRNAVIDSKDVHRISDMGWLYFACDERTRALELFNEAIRLDPELVGPRHGKGEFYFLQGQYALAIPVLEEAVRICPADYPSIHWLYRRLATAYFYTGNRPKAIEYLKKAFDHDQDLQLAYMELSQYFPTEKGKTEMLRELQALIHSDPQNPESKKFQFLVDFIEQKTGGFQDQRFRQLVDEILTNNLRKIFSEGRALGASVYVVNYPSAGYPPGETAGRFIDHSWPDHFIDVQSAFDRRVTPDNFKEYFIPDRHCTAQGYGIMARAVLDFLEERTSFFKEPSRPVMA